MPKDNPRATTRQAAHARREQGCAAITAEPAADLARLDTASKLTS